MKFLAILICSLLLIVPFADAQSPAEVLAPLGATTLPFPANSSGFLWQYTCPAGPIQCTATPPGSAEIPQISKLVIIFLLFRVGSQTVPTYFWWVLTVGNLEFSPVGFTQNPADFRLIVGNLQLFSAGPVGP